MIDIATKSTGTPFVATPLPAAVVSGCWADVVAVRMAGAGAPLHGTGLPVAGPGAAVRRRDLGGYATAPSGTALIGTALTGTALNGTALIGTDLFGTALPATGMTGGIAPSVHTEPTTPPTGTASGAPVQRTTPGDLPPEDPLS